MGRYATILQKGDLGRRYEEARVASGVTVYPGMLINLNSSGEVVIATPNAGGLAPTRIAIEDGIIGRTVDDAYTAGELVRYLIAAPGEYYAVLLKDGENVAMEDDLIAGDDGLFIKTTGTPSKTFFRAKEALDLSPVPNTTNKLILAEAY